MRQSLLFFLLSLLMAATTPGMSLASKSSTRAPAAAFGDLSNLPPVLAKALVKDFSLGFHLIRWELAPNPGFYMVELYHIDPIRVDSQREDFRRASSLGRGITIRKVIRP